MKIPRAEISQKIPFMDESALLIEALGTPRPQPRPRFVKERAVSVTDNKTKRWIAAVKSAAQGSIRSIGGAPGVAHILGGKGESLTMVCVFRIPTKIKERWAKPHSQDGRCDTDNLVKLVKDAIWDCGIVGAFKGGDGRVSVEHVVKVWCAPKDAGCMVRLERTRPLDEIMAMILGRGKAG